MHIHVESERETYFKELDHVIGYLASLKSVG